MISQPSILSQMVFTEISQPSHPSQVVSAKCSQYSGSYAHHGLGSRAGVVIPKVNCLREFPKRVSHDSSYKEFSKRVLDSKRLDLEESCQREFSRRVPKERGYLNRVPKESAQGEFSTRVLKESSPRDSISKSVVEWSSPTEFPKRVLQEGA